MGSLCKECLEKNPGSDNGSLAGIAPILGIARVLCDNCGMIFVNHDGEKVDLVKMSKIGDMIEPVTSNGSKTVREGIQASLAEKVISLIDEIFTDTSSPENETLASLQEINRVLWQRINDLKPQSNGGSTSGPYYTQRR